MKTLYRIALVTTGAAAATGFFWRFAGRRRTLPCPSWLSWLLENPFMNSVAGAGTILDRMALEPGMKVLDIGCDRRALAGARRHTLDKACAAAAGCAAESFG